MADTKVSALAAATVAALANEFPINEAGVSKKLTLDQIADLIGVKKKRLTTGFASTAVAPTQVTGLDLTLAAGTYLFEYFIRYQTSAATTGVKFDVNHSGTVTSMVWNQRFVGLIATASDANADQDSILAAAAVMNAFSSRAKGTAGRGVTLSADTLNADMLTIIEGLVVVTVSGDLQLYFGSEATGSTQTVMADSVLRVTEFL